MKSVLLFFLLLFTLKSFAQPEAYFEHTKKAAALLNEKQYAAAASEYSAAFQANNWKAYSIDRFSAARAWSMAGVPDSAFFNLFRLAERANYGDIDELNAEEHFAPLRSLPRWQELNAAVKANQPSMPELAKKLEVIWQEDQKYRRMVDSVSEKFGAKSKEMDALLKTMSDADASNTAIVTSVLDEHGWLGVKAVGEIGNSALFLVVQHADINVQEKYLPMMREAVKKGNAQGSSLALLEDRVLMRNGKKQIYGSQVRTGPAGEKYFFPIEDVDHVDERRASVGLGPLAQYAQYFNMIWDAAAIEKNRNMTPEPAEKRAKN